MTELTHYNAACRSLAEARRVDEVQEIVNRADALREYARRAKNRELEIDAAELRIRAQRRWGELAIEMRATGQFAEGRKKTVVPERQFSGEPERVTLADMGVSRDWSSHSQKLAAIAPESFEGSLSAWRQRASEEKERVTVSLLKEGGRAQEREDFSERTIDGCTVDDLQTLIDRGDKFATIATDPPWSFLSRSERGQDRAAARHYRTGSLADICALPVEKLAARDATLLIWAVMPMLPEAFDVIAAWGFEYKTCGFAWMKQNPSGEGLFMGNGYWTRANVELCLLATRGNPQRLDAGVRQAILSPRMEHSRKPDEIHDRIERLVPGPYLELYARRQRKNWVCWGNEIPRADFGDQPDDDDRDEALALPRFLELAGRA